MSDEAARASWRSDLKSKFERDDNECLRDGTGTKGERRRQKQGEEGVSAGVFQAKFCAHRVMVAVKGIMKGNHFSVYGQLARDASRANALSKYARS